MKYSRKQLLVVLGVALLILPPAAFAHEDEPLEGGVLAILAVMSGSATEAAGVQAGDRILEIAGVEVESTVELREVTEQYRPGDEVKLVVEREGETIDLPITLGEHEGRASLGVSLAIMTAEGADEFALAQKEGVDADECLHWVDETYALQEVAAALEFDLDDAADSLRVCMEKDLERMPSRIPVGWCDNVFKVHCSGLDLLTEIGEAQVDWCESTLEESLGIDLDSLPEWTTCGENKVFENFSMNGQSSDAAACRAALEECGFEAPVETSWLQWGGPERDFRAPATALAPVWPEGGPAILWSRSLGDGYSAILAEDGRLYTMLREGDYESVVSLVAATGKTSWEYRYPSVYMGMTGYGTGPRSTPLIVDNRLFTSSSPVAYEDMVIVPVGGQGASLVAFDQATGEVRWQKHSFRNSYSSPAIIEIAGETQLVAFMAEQLIGVDPATGDLLWQYPHANQWGNNITQPILIDKDTLFVSSPQLGARGLKLTRKGDAIEVEEIWSTRRVQFFHASAVHQGEWVYGSTGTTSPAFMTAINGHTGEIGWKKRGFAKANCVGADGKLVILDENGMLYLATATPEDLVVHSQTQLLDRIAWTTPTIVGTTMYVRDRDQIRAVDLG
ncbi:MAG: PQQ-binding-like beta-propeller repeat protein [Acidobacteriota bacterium]